MEGARPSFLGSVFYILEHVVCTNDKQRDWISYQKNAMQLNMRLVFGRKSTYGYCVGLRVYLLVIWEMKKAYNCWDTILQSTHRQRRSSTYWIIGRGQSAATIAKWNVVGEFRHWRVLNVYRTNIRDNLRIGRWLPRGLFGFRLLSRLFSLRPHYRFIWKWVNWRNISKRIRREDDTNYAPGI